MIFSRRSELSILIVLFKLIMLFFFLIIFFIILMFILIGCCYVVKSVQFINAVRGRR